MLKNLELKTKLLETLIVKDNEWLDKYIDLVCTKQVKKDPYKTNNHHIIPQYYFIINNLPIDNSDLNTVELLYKDHLLAHYYLALCSSNNDFIAKNALSIRFLLQGSTLYDQNISEIDFDEYQRIYELGRLSMVEKTHTPEVNKKVSEKLMGRPSPNKGNKKSVGRKSRANPNAKNKKLSLLASQRTGEKNTFYGKHHSDETKEKIAASKRKPVAMVDYQTQEIIKTFKSSKEATEYLYANNITQSSAAQTRIWYVATENIPTHKAYGFNWKFIEKV